MFRRLTLNKWMELIILFLVSALAYLPQIHHLGYYKDDWYLMYSSYTQGPEVFREIFSVDRPARGELLMVLYRVFGDNPLPYNVSAYIFRFMSAVGFLWVVRIVWTQKRTLTLLMTTLFVLYPGYLSQVNAIDFQSHNVSMFLAMFSIALSLRAISIKSPPLRYSSILLSILMGWAYMGLMEHAIGLEVFRFCCFYVVTPTDPNPNKWTRLRKTLKKFLNYLAIPFGFLFWRLFIFQNVRKATDTGIQFGELLASPVLTSLRWGIYTIQDILNVILLSWGVPLYNLGFQLRVRDTITGIGIAVLILLLTAPAISRQTSEDEMIVGKERKEALWIGLLTVLASIVPVITANRHITFFEYSRYALPGSVGAALVITSIIYYLNSTKLQTVIAYGLIATAAFTHHANAIQAASQFQSVKYFWWQVSWRIPQIREGTTLIAHYAETGIPEAYMVWGPANIIYYPEKRAERPYPITLPAVILSKDNLEKIIMDSAMDELFGRGWVFNPDYKNVLIISQSDPNSCVHVLNGQSMELSHFEDPNIMLAASSSDITKILVNAETHIPPTSIFNVEPNHTWCYYFQKADLARQSGDWDEVIRLGDHVQAASLRPNDQIEWMPFLQAYVVHDNLKQVNILSKFINTSKYYKYQACKIFSDKTIFTEPVSPEMETQLAKLFCQ